ncbi:hypothetical protein AB0H34_08145 [Saccharopolyspora shandongensis]
MRETQQPSAIGGQPALHLRQPERGEVFDAMTGTAAFVRNGRSDVPDRT